MGKRGFINKEGEMVIEPTFSVYCYDYFFSDGLAFVLLDDNIHNHDKIGYINKKGDIVIAPQFEEAFPFSEGIAFVREKAGGFVSISDHELGYVKGKGYLIDKMGKRLNNILFDEVEKFSEGMACVKINGKWGYIDTKDDLVINTQFDHASDFSIGLALVAIGENIWGYIDINGKFVINPQFNAGSPFVNGLAEVVFVNEDGVRIGYVNKSGETVAAWDQK